MRVFSLIIGVLFANAEIELEGVKIPAHEVSQVYGPEDQCYRIKNNTETSYFVPNKTTKELEAFITQIPSGLEAMSCKYYWIDILQRGRTHQEVCQHVGAKPAENSGYGICASGETRPDGKDGNYKGEGWESINYRYGKWGGHTTGGDFSSGSNCYKKGQKQDGDGTDITVAYLCTEPRGVIVHTNTIEKFKPAYAGTYDDYRGGGVNVGPDIGYTWQAIEKLCKDAGLSGAFDHIELRGHSYECNPKDADCSWSNFYCNDFPQTKKSFHNGNPDTTSTGSGWCADTSVRWIRCKK